MSYQTARLGLVMLRQTLVCLIVTVTLCIMLLVVYRLNLPDLDEFDNDGGWGDDPRPPDRSYLNPYLGTNLNRFSIQSWYN